MCIHLRNQWTSGLFYQLDMNGFPLTQQKSRKWTRSLVVWEHKQMLCLKYFWSIMSHTKPLFVKRMYCMSVLGFLLGQSPYVSKYSTTSTFWQPSRSLPLNIQFNILHHNHNVSKNQTAYITHRKTQDETWQPRWFIDCKHLFIYFFIKREKRLKHCPKQQG